MADFIDLGFAEASRTYNDKIVYVKYKNDPVIDMDAAKKIEEVVVELSQGLPVVVVTDVRAINGELETDAKDYLAKSKKLIKVRKAQVFIIDNLASRIVISFYSRLFRRNIKSKVFNNYESAIKTAEKFADE